MAVPEEGIVIALGRLAQRGLFAEPTSATAAAALDRLRAFGAIATNEKTVAVLTATGLKAASTWPNSWAARRQACSRFTSVAFTGTLTEASVAISMDGRGRLVDDVLIEGSPKHEGVSLKIRERDMKKSAAIAQSDPHPFFFFHRSHFIR
jgi:hypothetical protein